MSFAAVNGASLYYESTGEGEALVFIHAGIADSRMWNIQYEAFTRTHHAIRYDMRGYGKSPLVPGQYARYEDLHALLDELNIKKAVIVGCSLGGSTAIDFALAYPRRVRAVVGVNTALTGYQQEWEETPLIQAMEEAEEEAEKTGDLSRLCELEVQFWVAGPNRSMSVLSDDVRALAYEMNMIALKGDFYEEAEAVPLSPPAAERLDQLTCPLLLIHGEDDTEMTYNRLAYIQENAPDAQLITMPGAHLPNMEHPAQFNQILRDFLDSL